MERDSRVPNRENVEATIAQSVGEGYGIRIFTTNIRHNLRCTTNWDLAFETFC